MLKNKGGFTLIELVMIIIILGILAAVALPKYQDMASEARLAVVDGTVGAVKSAAVITFAKNRGVKGSLFGSIVPQVNMEDASVTSGSTCSSVTVYHLDTGTGTGSVSKTFDLSEYCS